jgi:small subunit ribosomal protein S27Ae
MNIFVKTLTEGTLSLQVDSSETVYDLKERIEAQEGVDADFQRLVYAGHNLEDEQTLVAAGLEENATVFLTLDLVGGKKKKKKAFTTKKKGHHKHVNVKLAVLKFYTVDGSGNVSRTRKSCPNCGVGVFMAKHFDRLYCGKCSLTFKLDPSQIEKPSTKKKEEKGAAEEDDKGKKDAKKKGKGKK